MLCTLLYIFLYTHNKRNRRNGCPAVSNLLKIFGLTFDSSDTGQNFTLDSLKKSTATG